MLVWLTLPFYDFCGFRSVAVNSVYKLQFFTFITRIVVQQACVMRRYSGVSHYAAICRYSLYDATRLLLGWP